jgi:TOMM system kinase/cyclase fusion protein
VQILDSGQALDGGLYTVFAFAPGDTLGAVLAREGALSPVEARGLMLQVLDALACAHAQNIVHRDLKPSNIMVVPTGARRHAVVLDFGIGAVVDSAPDLTPTRLTATDDTLGTPGYSAPEQSRGLEPSPRSDLFSWALVFLECLTGQPVYAGSSVAEIFYQLLGPDPVPLPPPMQRHPLGALLAKALQKDVAQRDISARALHEALEACDVSDLPGLGLATRPRLASSGTTLTSPGERRERRPVTALACELRLEAVSPRAPGLEESDEVMHGAMAQCAEVGRVHGGLTASVLGQVLLVYFGCPNAEEDDARRAGRAAIAMVAAIETRNAALEDRGVRLAVGVGLHTGFVTPAAIPGLGTASLVAGSTPRIAAALAAIAQDGTVRITSSCRKLLRGAFEVDGAELRAIPGSPGEVETLVLGEELDERTPTSADESRASLVGREREVELLLERWRRAREGAGQSAIVMGEAGIGKTRLVREIRERLVTEDMLFLDARCAPDAQYSPLLPFRDLLERALGLRRGAGTTERTARIARELSSFGIAANDAMPLLLPLFGLPVTAPYRPLEVSPPRQKALTVNAIVALLSAMAVRRPMLLLVEDLHWADSTTVEVLARLAQEASSTPILALMTARPDFSLSPPIPTTLQIPLGRLDRAQTEAMLADLTGRRRVAPAAVASIVQRTDGIPLFVEELTKMMLEEGLLEAPVGDGVAHHEPAERDIPTSLRALLTARLDRTGAAKGTAQLAAAIGREFRLDLLSAILPPGASGVHLHLDALARAGLVSRKGSAGDAVGVFKHALVRDAAYESLPRAERIYVHARIAQVLEERFPRIVDGRPDLLALHHEAADQQGRAVPYAFRAAQQALGRSAYAEAAAHAARVVEWSAFLPATERIEAELTANGVLTQALMARHGWGDPRVKARVDRSRNLVADLDQDSKHRVPALWSLFTYHHVASNRAAAREVARQVVGLAEQRKDRGLTVAGAALVGVAVHADGDHVASSGAFERVVQLHDRSLDRDHGPRFGLDSLVLAKALLAHHRWYCGEDEEAFRLVAESLEWAREVAHVPSIAIGLLDGCQVYHFAGDRRTAGAMTGEILRLAERYGLPAFEGYATAVHHWANGDVERSEATLERLSRTGSKLCMSYFGSFSAQALLEKGDVLAAIPRLERCLSLCVENDEHLYEPELWRMLGTAQLDANGANAGSGTKGGPSHAARHAFERAADLAHTHHMPRVEARALSSLLERCGGGADTRARLERVLDDNPGLRRARRTPEERWAS